MAAPLVKTKTPGIYRRGSRYVVIWKHRGAQHKKAFRTLAEAREWKGQVSTGQSRPISRIGFEEYALEWIDRFQGRTARGFRESTREDYRKALVGRAIPFFDKRCRLRLADITPRDVANFVAWLCDERAQAQRENELRREKGLPPMRSDRKRLSDSTVRNHLAPVRAMLATAVEEDLIRYNPAAGVRVVRAPVAVNLEHDELDGEKRALTQEELARLLGKVEPKWRLFFELLAHTGIRISEAVALEWRDVEFGQRPVLKVRRQLYRGRLSAPKSRYGRRDIPLSRGLSQRLWRLQGDPGEPVFTTARGSRLNRSNLYSRTLRPEAKAAGLEWVGFHSFRHTCASLLFDAEKNAKQVQEWLGHHSPAFTLSTYVHLLDGGLGDAEFLDARVAVKGEPVDTTTAQDAGAVAALS